ncbi:MAG: general stress protein B [Halobacteriota archaeon]
MVLCCVAQVLMHEWWLPQQTHGSGGMEPQRRLSGHRLYSRGYIMPRGHGNTELAEERMVEGRRKGGKRGGEKVAEERGPEFYRKIGEKGGEKTAETHGREFYEEIGQKGGEARGRERKKER